MQGPRIGTVSLRLFPGHPELHQNFVGACSWPTAPLLLLVSHRLMSLLGCAHYTASEDSGLCITLPLIWPIVVLRCTLLQRRHAWMGLLA
jgi:hypothetical protein